MNSSLMNTPAPQPSLPGRVLLRLLALALFSAALPACASKEDKENRYLEPGRFGRKPRDPVEHRVYYEGWRHPS